MRLAAVVIVGLVSSIALGLCDRVSADPLALLPGSPNMERARTPELGAARAEHASTLITVGPRYGIGGNSPLGEEQKENFQLYDLAGVFRTPWQWPQAVGPAGLELRVIASAGELTAAGTSGLMGTLVPALALTAAEGRVSLDLGTGPAFFSRHQFGVQDFGGPVQIIATVGLGLDVLPGFHAGYRFQHFSDAGIYGPTSLGVDMHIMDLSYRF